MLPGWNPGVVVSMLRRDGYTEEQEQETDLMASLIEARIRRRASTGPLPPLTAEAAETLARLAQTLGSGPR